MHILLIVPPNTTFEDFIHPAHNTRRIKKNNIDFGSLNTDMPIGLLSLSAYLKKFMSVEVSLLNFNVELTNLDDFKYDSFKSYFKEVLSRYKENPPDIVGISSLFISSYQNMIDIGEYSKILFPSSFIIAGGGVPTNMYHDIFSNTNCFDALCFGEGEKALLGLLQSKDKRIFCEEYPSWITRNKIHLNVTPKYTFIKDLDEIPFCDYGLCNTNHDGNPSFTAFHGIKQITNAFQVMTSRGCPYKCIFCASHTVHGRSMHYYSVSRVREDFTLLRDNFGARVFIIQDDNILVDRKRAIEIIKIIKELGVTAVFANGFAIYSLDVEILKLVKSAGITHINLPIESGSQRVLDTIIHKPVNLSKVLDLVNECRKLGIYTLVNLIIGFPGETKKDIEDTRKFLHTLPANWFTVFCVNPLVGSKLYDICKNKNIKMKSPRSDYKVATIETEEFSTEYIQDMEYILNLELNFVHNNDIRLGEYEIALKGLENAIKSCEDHAFAFYFAAKCYEKLGEKYKAREYRETTRQILQKSEFWRKYFNIFGLRSIKDESC